MGLRRQLLFSMEATLLKVDRLVDGIAGEDPTGTRLYMAQLREHEVGLSIAWCDFKRLETRLRQNGCVASRRLYLD